MIKFFRKIHFNALSRKRVPKYLIYATGEIILVVVGILTASFVKIIPLKPHEYVIDYKQYVEYFAVVKSNNNQSKLKL